MSSLFKADIVDSEFWVGIKSDDFGVMAGHLVEKFTHTWSAKHFVAQSNNYPGFMAKVSKLTQFPHELGSEIYSFLDQAVADFEHGLDSIHHDSVKTPKPDTYFKDT